MCKRPAASHFGTIALKQTSATGQAQFGPTTDAVDTYHLTYEPALFLAGSDGVVRDRLDSLFDEAEVSSALARLS